MEYLLPGNEFPGYFRRNFQQRINIYFIADLIRQSRQKADSPTGELADYLRVPNGFGTRMSRK
jgi:hypothetical protein